MADEDESWTFAVQGVSRISPDPSDEDGAVCFAVVFDCNGPNATAEAEVFIDDVEDEASIILLAMSYLHESFTAWARVTAGRRIAQPQGKPN